MDIQHLKQVSRIKHLILEKYLPPWEKILGRYNSRLCYFDCYAGPGKYKLEGNIVDGSPIIAIKSAEKFLSHNPDKEMALVLVEDDQEQLDSLEVELNKFKPYKKGLKVYPFNEDAQSFVKDLLDSIPNLAPSFFLIDPYGHPLTILLINQILSRSKVEALINFMYYRINMDAGNPKAQSNLDKMFGNNEWRAQDFLLKNPKEREIGFKNYFLDKIEAQYKIVFKIFFDPEDNMGQRRTKYYLIHASNHPKAVLLMKEVMWKLGDEEGVFEYSAISTPRLFSSTPTEDDLKEILLGEFKNRKVGFDQLREETWELPYIAKHYRSVVKEMQKEGNVKIIPVSSKTERGLSKDDIIEFI